MLYGDAYPLFRDKKKILRTKIMLVHGGVFNRAVDKDIIVLTVLSSQGRVAAQSSM